MGRWCLSAIAFLSACSFTPPRADEISPDAPIGDDGHSGGEDDRHLLLTEVLAHGNAELVEIFNPRDDAVALDTYFLTDANDYWKLPGVAEDDSIQLANSDYLMRFPAGATIGPGEVIVIAVRGPAFEEAFSTAPDYTLFETVGGAVAMQEVVATPSPNETMITDTGELLVLFQWDGVSDLVRDVDIVVHGQPSSNGNELAAKDDVDGPDPDDTPGSYAAEPELMEGMSGAAPGSNDSYKRIALEAGFEATTGGNGITGHAEVAEQIANTWDLGSSPVTPGTVPELPP